MLSLPVKNSDDFIINSADFIDNPYFGNHSIAYFIEYGNKKQILKQREDYKENEKNISKSFYLFDSYKRYGSFWMRDPTE